MRLSIACRNGTRRQSAARHAARATTRLLGACGRRANAYQYPACNAGAVQTWSESVLFSASFFFSITASLPFFILYNGCRSAWSNKDGCSVACGYGQQAQVRTCVGCYGGCPGSETQSVTCGAGSWKSWTNWVQAGGCDTTCGIGQIPYTRTCGGCQGGCDGRLAHAGYPLLGRRRQVVDGVGQHLRMHGPAVR